MIKMISGVCRVEGKLKRPGDNPFTLSHTEETRLVNAGVAVFVTTWRENRAPLPKEGEMLTGRLDAAELAVWKKTDLERLAKEMGVDISRAKNNAERAAILAAVEVQAPADGNDDGDAPPDLGVGDIVT